MVVPASLRQLLALAPRSALCAISPLRDVVVWNDASESSSSSTAQRTTPVASGARRRAEVGPVRLDWLDVARLGTVTVPLDVLPRGFHVADDPKASLRRQLFDRFPIHVHLGLELERIDGALIVVLPDQQATRNGFGTQAAASLFAVADAASGVALVTEMAQRVDELSAVVSSAKMRFVRPAAGRAMARGSVEIPAADLVERLANEGRARTPVVVDVIDDDGTLVAAGTVHWHLRPVEDAPSLWRRDG